MKLFAANIKDVGRRIVAKPDIGEAAVAFVRAWGQDAVTDVVDVTDVEGVTVSVQSFTGR